MAGELQKEDKTDISKNVEEILLGILLLFGSVITTFLSFLVKPHFFSKIVVEYDPLNDNFPKKYSRPITYLFASLAAITGGLILVFKLTAVEVDQSKNQFIILFSNAFRDGALIKLIIGLLPFLLAVGLYSFILFWVNKKKCPEINFQNSLYLSSYFIGTLALIYVAVVPIIPLSLNANSSTLSKIVVWTAALIAWSCLFRALYSYLVLLKHVVKRNRITTIKMFLKGFFIFFFVYYLILIWLSPLVSLLTED